MLQYIGGVEQANAVKLLRHMVRLYQKGWQANVYENF
jgi:hypothetical protein